MKANVKVYVSIIIVLFAALSVPLASMFLIPAAFSGEQETGIVIDFKDGDVTWTSTSFDSYSDPIAALEYACEINRLSYDIDGDVVNRIGEYESSMVGTWNLWVVDKGSTEWKRSDTSIKNMDYTVVCWAYRGEGGLPTVGTDYLGKSVYGFVNVKKIVTIAPSVTEIVSAVGASDLIVGTDQYSNFPANIEERKNSNEIKIVGGYTNPSYEEVLRCEPDLVFCYGGQQSHIELAAKLNSVGYNAIVMYDGEDLETIYRNIHIAGAALNYGMEALVTIESIDDAYSDILDILKGDNIASISAMLSLSAVKSPWASGSGTYLDDVLVKLYGTNVYGYKNGWFQATSASIVDNNPQLIIIVSSDYNATQQDYDLMLESMEPEWKSTDAFKNGNIYLYCETLGDIAQRPCPRIAQLIEVVARTLHGDSFNDGITLPKFLGNNYTAYLTYTKDLDFND